MVLGPFAETKGPPCGAETPQRTPPLLPEQILVFAFAEVLVGFGGELRRPCSSDMPAIKGLVYVFQEHDRHYLSCFDNTQATACDTRPVGSMPGKTSLRQIDGEGVRGINPLNTKFLL